jgi:hypothetical protein
MPMNPRLLRPLASGWTPRQLPDLGLWLDASDAATVTVATGVSEWRDKSGRGLHASQATAGSQPAYSDTQNGRKVVTFDGSDDHLSGVAPFSTLPVFGMGVLFFPSRKDIGVVYEQFTGATDNVAFYRGHSSTDGFRIFNGTNLSSTVFPANNEWHLMGFLAGTTSANSQLYYNGTVDVTGNAGTATPQTGGYYLARWAGAGASPEYTPMRMGEWIGLNREPTTAERQKIEGYLAWKWGLQSQLPYDHPYAASFPGFGSQATPTDADTLTYLAAVKAADGTGVEVGVANAVDAFVTGCKSDGIWDAIKASCILAGARTLAGALVPLRGSAPTNNNFAEADYNRETGLVGDGSTTSLDTNRAHDIDGQDDRHAAVWISAAATGGSDIYLGTVATNPTYIQRTGATTTFFIASGGNTGSRTTATGLAAVKRSSSSEIETYMGGSSATTASTSGAPTAQNYFVFDRAAGSLAADARLAFYSIGESLDLAALDTRVSALITAIGNAI